MRSGFVSSVDSSHTERKLFVMKTNSPEAREGSEGGGGENSETAGTSVLCVCVCVCVFVCLCVCG